MTAGRSNLVDVEGRLLIETDDAYLIEADDRQAWVPKSQCEHDGHGIFTMPEWLAIEKGLV